MSFKVLDAATHEELPGIPTPRLIEAHRADAYFVPSEDHGLPGKLPGVWYLREEPRFVSPDGKYTKVLIAHEESF